MERDEVTTVRVHRARRAAGREEEQVALDVGVGGSHGARPDSSGTRRLLRGALCLVLSCFALGALPGVARASQLIGTNSASERLAVSKEGVALVTYHAKGRVWHVLAWGAVNARQPSRRRPQVAFRLDYSGGWGRFDRPVWKTLGNTCGSYRGPSLPYLVAACTARDGSNWALQRWQRLQANFGIAPWKPGHGAWELRLSHWTGPVATIQAWPDWSYAGRWHHLFGRLTYRGHPVYGFATTPEGVPLDGYGRVLYVDTFDSAYGPGWRRENGFVARNPDGSFCYVFVPHRDHTGEIRPPGNGRRYRISVSGPGVTPDVTVEIGGLPDFDRENTADVELEARMNDLQRRLVAGTAPCRP